MDRPPYTHEELQQMLGVVHTRLAALEQAYAAARPVPPMKVTETLDYLNALIDRAGTRALTPDEQFLMGQLHQQLRQAVIAYTLGYRGRYYVVSEEELARLQEDR
jgi:hypothetical protein